MAGISFIGMNSGLPPNIVEQLMEAERVPVRNLDSKKQKAEVKLNLVSDLEGKLNKVKGSIGTLASTKGFTDIQLISGDNNILQGTVDPDAGVNGNWNIEVQKLAQKAAAITNGFPDKDKTELGTGYFKFKTPKGDKEVYINGSNNTLERAVAAINSADVGIKASVINDRKEPDAPFKLMLSGDSVGGDNKIDYPTLYFLDGDQDLYFDQQQEASNGVVKVDGFEFEISSNTIKDIIPGVTLEVRQASPGRTVNVSVKENQEVVSGKIKEFVDAMNEALAFIQSQSKVDGKTDTTKTLGGDGMIRSIEQRLRQLIQNSQVGVSGEIRRLNQLGIQFNRNGTLDFDQQKFNNALAKNPPAVQAFFAGDGFATGFIPSLKRQIDTVLNQVTGSIPIRKKGLEDRIAQIDRQIESKEKLLEKKEESLKRQFGKLEETMNKLKAQGGALGSMGAALPNVGISKG